MKRSCKHFFTILILFVACVILFYFITAFCNYHKINHVNFEEIGNGNTIISRFDVPKGYSRIRYDTSSFGYYLQHLGLKPVDSKIRLYNGQLKANQNVHEAVIDISVGNKNLQQCADACIRLRAEYLFKQNRYNDIHFKLTNGFDARYEKWIQGYRINVNGNKTNWVKSASPSNTHKDLLDYLEIVFSYAGTLSLSKELKAVKLNDMKLGDIFIMGGNPGHAVMVADMAINSKTKEKVFMLIQSYMPAQEIHVLKNPKKRLLSPWYSLDFGNTLYTPEWIFSSNALMRFRED